MSFLLKVSIQICLKFNVRAEHFVSPQMAHFPFESCSSVGSVSFFSIFLHFFFLLSSLYFHLKRAAPIRMGQPRLQVVGYAKTFSVDSIISVYINTLWTEILKSFQCSGHFVDLCATKSESSREMERNGKPFETGNIAKD